MLIETHIIQSFAPSNLNRDDTGNPKESLFGGVRRARISSQAQKRPIRTSPYFAEAIQTGLGLRTKRLAAHIAEQVAARGLDAEEALKRAAAFVEKFSKQDKDNKAKVLTYISPEEVNLIVEQLMSGTAADDFIKAFIKETKGRTSAPDIALFGRMLADKPELNMDAACQVAHAISTHQATLEFDYFTAIDDLQKDDTSGADMIGLVPFNSATFYRYARIDWRQLVQNLDGDEALAARTVVGFLRGLVFALPTGKQNTFAAHSLPDFLLGVVRPNAQGWSLANAFEKPISARGGGYAEPSVKAMLNYWGQMRAYELVAPAQVAIFDPRGLSQELPAEAIVASVIGDWIDQMVAVLPQGS